MKHLTLTSVLFTLLSTCVQADTDAYGLLFTTPDQRARLDNRFNSHSTSSNIKPGTVNGERGIAHTLKINGTLVSSSGKKEVWINGESQLAAGDENTKNVRLLSANKVRIKPSTSGPAHDLKPGQTLDPNTGSVSEAYEQASLPQPPTENSP